MARIGVGQVAYSYMNQQGYCERGFVFARFEAALALSRAGQLPWLRLKLGLYCVLWEVTNNIIKHSDTNKN
jgi:hypothetical protein